MKTEKLFRRTRKDIWLFRAVALIIAIILWMTVLGGERVEINKVIYFDYQIPEHLMISNNAPKEMIVRVAGPQAFIKDYEARKITRTIDLTKAEQKEYDIPIKDLMLDLPLGIQVISLPIQNLFIRLDRAAWKRVPVRAAFVAALPEGFRVTNVTLKPSTVEIRGPESRLKLIDSLQTDGITLANDSLVQEFESRISVKDHPGVLLDEQSQQVNVIVQIEGSLKRRTIERIPVRVRLTGANGRVLNKGSLQVTPSEVTFLVEGPEEIINDLSRAQIDVWAELPELVEGLKRVRLDWGLPPGIRVVRRSTDWVEVLVPAGRNGN